MLYLGIFNVQPKFECRLSIMSEIQSSTFCYVNTGPVTRLQLSIGVPNKQMNLRETLLLTVY